MPRQGRSASNRLRLSLKLAGRHLLYAAAAALCDFLGFLLWLGFVPREKIVLVLFLEGGLGLLLGVAIALSSTPFIAGVGKVLLGTSSWSLDSQNHAENVGVKWMLSSAFLLMIGFAVSLV